MEGRVTLRSLQKASRALQQKQQQQTVKWPHRAQAWTKSLEALRSQIDL